MKNFNADIVIIGAGLTGLCSASILSILGYKIVLIDKNKISFNHFKKNDLRTTALSEGSKNLLNKYGLWKNIKPYAQPIKKIKIFDRKSSNKIDFSNPYKKEYLGYIIENKFLKNVFLKKIISNKKIIIKDNINFQSLDYDESSITVHSSNFSIKSKLLIAADGKNESY